MGVVFIPVAAAGLTVFLPSTAVKTIFIMMKRSSFPNDATVIGNGSPSFPINLLSTVIKTLFTPVNAPFTTIILPIMTMNLLFIAMKTIFIVMKTSSMGNGTRLFPINLASIGNGRRKTVSENAKTPENPQIRPKTGC